MTQRILVVLDPDSDTPVATDTAIDIARQHDGEVTGLAFVDKDSIGTETAGGGIGSMYFAERLREQLTEETRQKAAALIDTFTTRVEAEGVRHSGDRVGEGALVKSLLDEMRTHDLLVAGRESHFYYADPDRRTHTLGKVLQDAAAATLIVGTARPTVRRVAVAYDGSGASARTMQKFAHLAPFGTDVDVEVVHVRGGSDADRLASERLREDAVTYLRAHGFERVTSTGIESSDPSERICELAQGDRADLVVSGAFAKSGFRKMIFGSSATKLLEESKVPLFLYH
ncbi:universal stress protein [Rubrivirga sp.]|uniref:universal stress protein n=1 Tax=Rubrivirga sp. TaxID=1885344 RepID=UPI003B527234